MVEKTRGRREVARVAAWLLPIAGAVGLAAACAQLKGSLGDQCLKNEDCQSGLCSQLRCVAAPELLDATPGAPEDDGASDGAETDGPGTPADGGAPAPDAALDASPGDGGADQGADAPSDAPADAPHAMDDGATDAAGALLDAGDAAEAG